MIHRHPLTSCLALFLVVLFSTSNAAAQGFGKPLTMQGVDHFTLQSAGSRGFGGITVGVQGDIGLMFSNPATLQGLQGPQVSVGAIRQSSSTEQVQQYGPLSYYSNFSLLMEGLTGMIPNPAYDTVAHKPVNAADTVQRPFDNLGPNWSKLKSRNIPMQFFAAMPLTVSDAKVVVGVGAVEYANLDWYFQNNNVLSPSVLSVDPTTTPIPRNNSDSASFPVQWYQYYQRRSGSIYGYGGALSILLSEKLSFGVSGMVLSGSSTDKESRIERGRLRFYQSYFRVEPVYYHVVRNGTSDYSGAEFTLSGSYSGKYIGIGFSLKPPTTITRKYTSQVQTDTTGLTTLASVSGQDKMVLPWRGTLGLSIALKENITLGLEYELRPYASAQYQDQNGSASNPWLSSNLFHAGVEYTPISWLVIRAGVREQAEIFEPVGNPLEGDPVSCTVYALGAGVKMMGVRCNVAYEYGSMKYVDTWADAVSKNSSTPQSIIADVSYEVPW